MTEGFLEQALEQARARRGFCAPNPCVGAVVVKEGRILSRGFHRGPGQRHAEVEALAPLGEDARGSTVYVTLEPCCHTEKRTPPCTRYLIERKVGEVIYGYRDPNPQVCGRGEAELRGAGISCTFVAHEGIGRFYESYAHWSCTGRPFVTAKLALSLDGRIAGEGGARVQLTGERLCQLTHESRRAADAILTTVRTILADDPLLTARVGNLIHPKPLYVIDRSASLPLHARIFETGAPLTVFHGADAPPARLAELERRKLSLVPMAFSTDGIDLNAVMENVGKDGWHDLWVEAGGRLFESLLGAGLVQRALLYVAPRWIGEAAPAAFRKEMDEVLRGARLTRWSGVGRDALCEMEW